MIAYIVRTMASVNNFKPFVNLFKKTKLFLTLKPATLTSYPGLPCPDFISQAWRNSCEIKSGRGRPGYKLRFL